MRAGDHVYHRPTGETWVVAYIDDKNLGWCGWPPGEARIEDCELVKSCTDEEHERLLRELAKSEGKRAEMAQRELMKRGEIWGDQKPKLEWEELAHNGLKATLGHGLNLLVTFESIERLDPGEPRWNCYVFGMKLKRRMKTAVQAQVRAEMVALRWLNEAKTMLESL